MTSTDSPDPSEKPEPIASVTALGSLDEAAYERKGQRSSRLWRKRNEKDTDSQESLPTTSPDKKPEPDLQPTSFLRLFRFATKWELSLNLVGLVAACAAGSAQVGISV
ncbi:hypothetical protein NM688_g7789 [Phlebia brevispora]|uniref:Uncharacterized protein n=1 Tax=Phlebia brevispora TaxID=194682 RepID=A0ACC1S145_9APHY|nr:hypothetical protein NM688_g7789 [Phlebia brevispora]